VLISVREVGALVSCCTAVVQLDITGSTHRENITINSFITYSVYSFIYTGVMVISLLVFCYLVSERLLYKYYVLLSLFLFYTLIVITRFDKSMSHCRQIFQKRVATANNGNDVN